MAGPGDSTATADPVASLPPQFRAIVERYSGGAAAQQPGAPGPPASLSSLPPAFRAIVMKYQQEAAQPPEEPPNAFERAWAGAKPLLGLAHALNPAALAVSPAARSQLMEGLKAAGGMGEGMLESAAGINQPLPGELKPGTFGAGVADVNAAKMGIPLPSQAPGQYPAQSYGTLGKRALATGALAAAPGAEAGLEAIGAKVLPKALARFGASTATGAGAGAAMSPEDPAAGAAGGAVLGAVHGMVPRAPEPSNRPAAAPAEQPAVTPQPEPFVEPGAKYDVKAQRNAAPPQPAAAAPAPPPGGVPFTDRRAVASMGTGLVDQEGQPIASPQLQQARVAREQAQASNKRGIPTVGQKPQTPSGNSTQLVDADGAPVRGTTPRPVSQPLERPVVIGGRGQETAGATMPPPEVRPTEPVEPPFKFNERRAAASMPTGLVDAQGASVQSPDIAAAAQRRPYQGEPPLLGQQRPQAPLGGGLLDAQGRPFVRPPAPLEPEPVAQPRANGKARAARSVPKATNGAGPAPPVAPMPDRVAPPVAAAPRIETVTPIGNGSARPQPVRPAAEPEAAPPAPAARVVEQPRAQPNLPAQPPPRVTLSPEDEAEFEKMEKGAGRGAARVQTPTAESAAEKGVPVRNPDGSTRKNLGKVSTADLMDEWIKMQEAHQVDPHAPGIEYSTENREQPIDSQTGLRETTPGWEGAAIYEQQTGGAATALARMKYMDRLDAELKKRGVTDNELGEHWERKAMQAPEGADVSFPGPESAKTEPQAAAKEPGDLPPIPPKQGEPLGATTAELTPSHLPLDPSGEQELRAEVERLRAQGLDKYRVGLDVQRQQASEFAKTFGFGPNELDQNKVARLSGAEIVGLKNILTRNLDELTQLTKAAGRDGASMHDVQAADERGTVLRQQNQSLIQKIIRATSQKGRDLGFLSQMAHTSLDPDVWVYEAQRVAERPLSDEEIADVRKKAQDASKACLEAGGPG